MMGTIANVQRFGDIGRAWILRVGCILRGGHRWVHTGIVRISTSTHGVHHYLHLGRCLHCGKDICYDEYSRSSYDRGEVCNQ